MTIFWQILQHCFSVSILSWKNSKCLVHPIPSLFVLCEICGSPYRYTWNDERWVNIAIKATCCKQHAIFPNHTLAITINRTSEAYWGTRCSSRSSIHGFCFLNSKLAWNSAVIPTTRNYGHIWHGLKFLWKFFIAKFVNISAREIPLSYDFAKFAKICDLKIFQKWLIREIRENKCSWNISKGRSRN